MENLAVVRPRYKEIICVNVEHGDRSSMNKKDNILPGAFIDTKN